MILTKEEVGFMTGPSFASKDQKDKVVRKLVDFQREITDPWHIIELNRFIPKAVAYAEKRVKLSKDPDKTFVFDRAFHTEMNRSTKREGLRV